MFSLGLIAAAAASGCPAIPVQSTHNPLLGAGFADSPRWIEPKPRRLYAVMWSGRAVDGRFSVYAHGFNPVTGISEKIMWVVPRSDRPRAGYRIRMSWWRGGERRRVQYAGRSAAGSSRPGHLYRRGIYPSILNAPDEGCWKLKLHTGKVDATIHVLVQPQPQP
jgi:hypothetical protein